MYKNKKLKRKKKLTRKPTISKPGSDSSSDAFSRYSLCSISLRACSLCRIVYLSTTPAMLALPEETCSLAPGTATSLDAPPPAFLDILGAGYGYRKQIALCLNLLLLIVIVDRIIIFILGIRLFLTDFTDLVRRHSHLLSHLSPKTIRWMT